MSLHLCDTTDFSNDTIEHLILRANEFLDGKPRSTLQGKLVVNMFFENSTRTRSSFEIATKRLGGEVVNLDIGSSSTKKGETLLDTALNLDAMSPQAIIVRHKENGVPRMLSRHTNASIINGGDGNHAHPTQALLDLMTLKNHFGDLKGKRLAIVGDIINSRVASSNLELLPRFGIDITLVGPDHFLPPTHHKTSNSIKDIIDDVDAIMSLRTQTERHDQPIYNDLSEYGKDYCVTKDLLGSRNIAILHPGPVHRNIDISDEVLDGENSLVLTQVKNGVAMRMAILEYLLTSHG